MATRRILSGENLISGEIEPPASQLKRLLESNKTELSAVPGGGWRMISMDTSRPPFDDINVRKAAIAGFNRDAARQQRGGEALGPIAQHLIPPGMAGFEESNGAEGWVDEMDWLASGGRPRPVGRVLQEGGLRLRQVRGRRGAPDRRRQRRAGQVDRRRSPSSSSTRWASRRSSAS